MYVTFVIHSEMFCYLASTFSGFVCEISENTEKKNHFILSNEHLKPNYMKFTVTAAEEQLVFLI